jgi:UDP-2,3-diacylglucosamine pyrophosphatase LpxH
MKYKSVFVSDIHLGTRDSQAGMFLEFIRDNEFEELYLVGDIIDGWSLKRRWTWPQEHSDVIQKILRAARKGTKVVYVLGNHDEFIRPFLPIYLGDNIDVVNSYDYYSLDGKKYWVVHGDFFDSITMTKKWLALLGDRGYQLLLRANRPLNYMRKRLGKKYWSLSAYIKEHVKKSVMYINDYENIISSKAKSGDYDGVICGHIHKAENRYIDGVRYLNCGDWVESCSAVVEDYEGEFKVLRFEVE